jgi:trk system potassium uptake protein TrkH
MILMVLGSTSFVTSWALLTGRLRRVLQATEVRLFLVLSTIATFILMPSTLERSSSWGKAVRVAAFEAISALTTTGFSTTSYTGWPSVAMVVLITLMIVGGGAGSTAGGFKQLRVAVLVAAARDEVRRRFHPTGTVVLSHVEQGGRRTVVDAETVQATAGFAALYAATLLAGVLVLAAYGIPLEPAIFEMTSALNTVGLSVGVTSAARPDGVLWTLTVAMFLGRLELVAVLVGVASCCRSGARLLSGVARAR